MFETGEMTQQHACKANIRILDYQQPCKTLGTAAHAYNPRAYMQ